MVQRTTQKAARISVGKFRNRTLGAFYDMHGNVMGMVPGLVRRLYESLKKW